MGDLEKFNSKEIFVSSVKGLLGAVPYVGTALTESLFEYRSRIKQNRVNRFVEIFTECLREHDLKEIDINNIHSEEFGDIFESIIRKVSETRNEQKLQRFKKILTKQIINPEQVDFIETYLDLVNKLNEKEIEILFNHREYLEKIKVLNDRQTDLRHEKDKLTTRLQQTQISRREPYTVEEKESDSKLQTQIDAAEEQIKKLSELGGEIHALTGHVFYNLSKGDYSFYIQDLVSKGLLFEFENDNNHLLKFLLPSKSQLITEFGKKFLDFISDSSDSK